MQALNRLGCFCLGLLLANAAFAQNEFKAGFLGGLSATQVDGDNYGGYNKLGFSAGAFTNIYFSDNIGAEIEVLFIQKGSRKTPNIDKGDPTAYFLRLFYAEVPLLVKFKLKKIIIDTGPSFGRLLSSKEGDSFGTLTNTEPFSDWEFAANFGISYPFNDNFSITGRFSTSIIPIRKFNTTPPAYASFSSRLSNLGQYNTVMQLLVAYQF